MISERYTLNGKIPWSLNPVQKQHRDKLIKLINEQERLLIRIKKCHCRGNNLEQLTEKDRFGLPIGAVLS